MPMFPQPNQNTMFQQPTNQGYTFIDDDLQILGATSNTNSQDSGSFMNNGSGLFQPNGQFHMNNNAGFQQNSHPQTGIAGGAYLHNLQQHGTQMYTSSQQTAIPRPPPRAASRSPSRSPSRAGVRGPMRPNQPKDVPDGGYRNVVCKNCHHEWWNTWCDDEKQDTCYNCWKSGVECVRPQCPDFQNCTNPRCKGAHEQNGFLNTVEMENKRSMKRKNRMTEDHEEPPRKRMKEQGGDSGWDA
ncbi:hypothetical protein P171DRAFT_426376 [Karstenula rhodostoma CBS 690.94]|uniref:Uncharacterized protein n=1 Tax=Karstenula rhodostoma CBS 690.94 TaxID=1392251 RepID=A0A9P4UIP7_9PLEO|nr:hypothetical protein P171DRAFT_426376 [Karstenula rhodostoma CBS 690.94]